MFDNGNPFTVLRFDRESSCAFCVPGIALTILLPAGNRVAGSNWIFMTVENRKGKRDLAWRTSDNEDSVSAQPVKWFLKKTIIFGSNHRCFRTKYAYFMYIRDKYSETLFLSE